MENRLMNQHAYDASEINENQVQRATSGDQAERGNYGGSSEILASSSETLADSSESRLAFHITQFRRGTSKG